MGGDNRGDATNNGNTDQATQHVLDQLNAKLAQDAGQGQTRANYGGVAPLTDNLGQKPHSSDPYYHGTKPGGRAGYGVDGTLAPGGAGTDGRNSGQNGVPSFTDIHRDQQRNPSDPYERNNTGVPQQPGQPGQGANRPGRVQPADPTGMHINELISKRGLYLSPWTPIFGGVGSLTAPMTAKLLSKGADGLVERTTPGSFGHKVGSYWQNNYDPTRVGAGDLVKPTVKTAAADSQFAKLVEETRGLTTSGADDAAKALAREKLEMLGRPITASTVVDLKAASAARAEAGGAALFSEAELATIQGKYDAGLARAAQEKAVIESLQKGSPSLWKSAKAGMVGIGVDILAVNLDRSVAKAIGGEKSLIHSWNTEQLLAPTALALGENIVGKSFWGKAALVAGTIGVSRLVDGATQAVGLGAPEKWNAPTGVMNGWDGFGVATGLAIAASAKNPYAKFGAVALGWAIPKVVHAFEDNSSNALAYRYEDLTSSVASDHKKRSYSSLESVTSASVSLNEKKEDWLVGKIAANRDTLAKNWSALGPDQKLLSFRDDAGMSKALGEDLLKHGTRISKQGAPTYTLGGYEIDLGGRAMHYLISGKDSAERAAAMTDGIIKNNADPSRSKILVEGSEPTQSEIDGLNKFKGEIQTDLAKILDQKHDCRAVMNQVVKDVPAASDEWRRTYITPTDGLIEHYFPRNAPEQAEETKKVIAKLYRDQAIAYMAFAQFKLDHQQGDGGAAAALTFLENRPTSQTDIFPSGRQKRYNGAEGVLAMAAMFDPNNKDLPELNQMYKELHDKAVAASGQPNKLDILDFSNTGKR